MRRLAAFLLLLGVGVAVLWWLDQGRSTRTSVAPLSSFGEPREPRGPTRADDGLEWRGAFEILLYEKGTEAGLQRLALHVESDDSANEADFDLLRVVRIRIFDPSAEDDEPRGLVNAAVARLPRKGWSGLRPDYSGVAELEDVEGTLTDVLSGTTLAFETPSAVLDASDPSHVTLDGESPIHFTSPEFEAGGKGFHLDVVRVDSAADPADPHGEEDVIELRRDGWLSFRREATGEEPEDEPRTGRFETTGPGPLQIRREGREDPRPISFEVWQGGRLTLTGPEASTLSGRHIVLRGRSIEARQVVRPERVEVVDDALWTSGPNTFSGRSLAMDFDATGGFKRALLEGLPKARVVVSLRPADADPEGRPVEEEAALDIRSDRSIELRQGRAVVSYTVAGKATVESEGLTLRSNGDLLGSRTESGDAASFMGTGGVVVETSNGTLEAAEFELRMFYDADGDRVVNGTARGGARLIGTLPDGRPFAVTSPDQLEVERAGDSLRVVEGVRVDLSISEPPKEGEDQGEQVFVARADRISDLALSDRTFQASGRVHFDDGHYVADCARLEAKGDGVFTIWGSEEAKASFRSDFGSARAAFVDVSRGRVEAHGAVEAKLTSLPDTAGLGELVFDGYDLTCEELVVTRGEEAQADGTVARRFDLNAKERVVSTLRTGGRTVVLRRADELVALRVDHLASDAPGALEIGSRTELRAAGNVEAHVSLIEEERAPPDEPDRVHRPVQKNTELTIRSDELTVTREVAEAGATEPDLTVLAQGRVSFEGARELDFQGEGEILRIDPDRTAHLLAPRSGLVRLFGVLPTHGLPFRLTASKVDFSPVRIEADHPEILVTRLVTPATAEHEPEEIAYRARARTLVATEQGSLELIESARLNGQTKGFVPWTLDAQRVVLEGTPGGREGEPAELSRISATGGVTFRIGASLVAHADALFGVRPTGVLRLIGSPATVESSTIPRVSADWMDFDPELQIILEAGKGSMESVGKAGGNGGSSGPPGQDPKDDAPWDVGWNWMTTRIDGDSLILCFQEPTISYPDLDTSMRASWTVFWLDRDQWRDLSDNEKRKRQREARDELEEVTLGPMRVFFDLLEKHGVSGLVREAYFEGPVEIFRGEDLLAHADAIYFDLTSGHGWLANATVNVYGRLIGQDFEKLTIKANWLRHSSDGSLQANHATLTSCSDDDPHLQIVTGDLRLTPLSNDIDSGYEVSLRNNSIEMYDIPSIPLPPIGFDTDEELKPDLPSLRLGNSARFGQLFNFRFSSRARKLGSWFHDLFTIGEDEEEAAAAPDEVAAPAEAPDPDTAAAEKKKKKKRKSYNAINEVDGSYLGSRGALLDLGFRTDESDNRYAFDFLTGIVLDRGKDKGYVRVDESDRDTTRLWLRSHGWFEWGKNRYLFAYTDESDPGVQSEFFERDFVRYEEYESFVQWKRFDGHSFAQATVKTRTEAFRADVEELPAATVFSGRAPLLRLGPVTVLHTGELSAGYLRRRRPSSFDLNGDGSDDGPLISPFRGEGGFDDPFDPTGSREVVRADLVQTLEAPLSLRLLGLRLVPFVSARGTSWDRAAVEDDASRVVTEAGARLSTVLWNRSESGKVHQLVPRVAFRSELDSSFEGTPHTFDDTESALFGDFVEVGTRTRFGVEGDRSRLDLDLKGVHASSRSDGKPDGWLPIEAFGRLGLEPAGQVFDVWYDGRYDTDEGEFVYSLFSLGTRFGDDFGLQVGHHFGRDENLTKLFDAATVTGFWRWTEKWEFEARQTVSLQADDRLGASVLVRRYGHDLIFEIETESRSGEGTSLNFGVSPRLGFRPSRIGYIQW